MTTQTATGQDIFNLLKAHAGRSSAALELETPAPGQLDGLVGRLRFLNRHVWDASRARVRGARGAFTFKRLAEDSALQGVRHVCEVWGARYGVSRITLTRYECGSFLMTVNR